MRRGLSHASLFVTDDFRGLHRPSKYFPSSRHQLCLVHLETSTGTYPRRTLPQ
uniref:transposase n=1 Tax=Sulfodiicoccus acidiphilus TaxID=1670455 RepID=UPI000F834341